MAYQAQLSTADPFGIATASFLGMHKQQMQAIEGEREMIKVLGQLEQDRAMAELRKAQAIETIANTPTRAERAAKLAADVASSQWRDAQARADLLKAQTAAAEVDHVNSLNGILMMPVEGETDPVGVIMNTRDDQSVDKAVAVLIREAGAKGLFGTKAYKDFATLNERVLSRNQRYGLESDKFEQKSGLDAEKLALSKEVAKFNAGNKRELVDIRKEQLGLNRQLVELQKTKRDDGRTDEEWDRQFKQASFALRQNMAQQASVIAGKRMQLEEKRYEQSITESEYRKELASLNVEIATARRDILEYKRDNPDEGDEILDASRIIGMIETIEKVNAEKMKSYQAELLAWDDRNAEIEKKYRGKNSPEDRARKQAEYDAMGMKPQPPVLRFVPDVPEIPVRSNSDKTKPRPTTQSPPTRGAYTPVEPEALPHDPGIDGEFDVGSDLMPFTVDTNPRPSIDYLRKFRKEAK